MHPQLRGLFTLLAAMCLALGVGSCGDFEGSSAQGRSGGAGGPDEATMAPPTDSGDGGAGGPDEVDGDTPNPTRDTTAAPTVTPSVSIASACVGILRADEEAVAALDDFARRSEPEESQAARDDVVKLFDEARTQIEDYLEVLPPGLVRDVGARLLTEQTAVRDALSTGSPVRLDRLREERAALEHACGGV